MKQRRPVIEGSREVADMHHLRLMSLLQELERAHGRKEAAELLGVDRRTLDISLDEGVLSRRMRGALDKALQAGVGSAAAEQRDRNDKLEDRLDALEALVEERGKEMRVRHRALEDSIRAVREEVAQAHRQLGRTPAKLRTEGSSEGETKANGAGPQPRKQFTMRREFPDLVTVEPAEEDKDVFGEVWPLIVEWRELKAVHPDEGKSLDWLLTEERFLALELTLLEEHRLTLLPATFPLRGFDRNGQVNWRKTALSDTRRALRKRELLHTLTLGLWWK